MYTYIFVSNKFPLYELDLGKCIKVQVRIFSIFDESLLTFYVVLKILTFRYRAFS